MLELWAVPLSACVLASRFLLIEQSVIGKGYMPDPILGFVIPSTAFTALRLPFLRGAGNGSDGLRYCWLLEQERRRSV